MKLLFFLFLLPIYAISNEILIAVPEHHNYSAQNGSGYLNDLLSLFKENIPENVKFVYLPLRRAIKEHSSGNYHCMAGGDESLIRFYGGDPSVQFFSRPYHVLTTRLLTVGDKPICDLKQMRKKSLIVIDNFPFEKVLGKNRVSRVEKAADPPQGIKMLLNGRADALISYYPTPDPGVEKLSFCSKLYFTKSFEKIHCFKNPEAKKAISAIDNIIKRLESSGELEALLVKHFKGYGSEIYRYLKKDKAK